MYTITVKDQDKQVYKAHGSNLQTVTKQVMNFITRKYQHKRS